jgi:hypothetical protein
VTTTPADRKVKPSMMRRAGFKEAARRRPSRRACQDGRTPR